MTKRERLMATLNGQPVDRPAVCFYELNGIDQNPHDTDEFNVYSHPSWKPLLDMTLDRTDRIVLRSMNFKNPHPNIKDLSECKKTRLPNSSLQMDYTYTLGDRTFTYRDLREVDVDTIWNISCVFKDAEDLEYYLSFPDKQQDPVADTEHILETEQQLGEDGIVCIDIPSPLCIVAQYFDMADYMVIAMTERELFHRALAQVAERLLREVEVFSAAAPGRLWRIYGPEYAAAPFLPPALFYEYAIRYDKPLVDAINKHGGFPRIHCHGNLRGIIDHIAGAGYAGIDPIEPPPQGDMALSEVRAKLGKDMVLFGNIEISEIETLDEAAFTTRVKAALNAGCSKESRGFVLMPTACPIGRILNPRTVRNYEIMIQLAEEFKI